MRKNPQKRPKTITMIIWGLLLCAAWNAGRAFAINQQGQILLLAGGQPSPEIRLVLALGWTLLFLSAAIILWQKRPWSRYLIPLLVFLYGINELGLLFWALSPTARQQSSIMILYYTGVLIFTVWTLHRPAARPYFHGPAADTPEGRTAVDKT